MQIAQMQDRKAIKCVRELAGLHVVAPNSTRSAFLRPRQNRPVIFSVYSMASAEESRIFDVEEVQPLPEHLGFVILLYPEALLSVQASKALLKETQFDIFCLKSPRCAPWFCRHLYHSLSVQLCILDWPLASCMGTDMGAIGDLDCRTRSFTTWWKSLRSNRTK